MSMMETVREFICQCPFLKNGLLNVNYLGPYPTEYVIERVAADEVLKEYSDSGKLKQFVFSFASREWIGKNVEENQKIVQFYENFAGWLDEMSAAGRLPVLGEGKTAQSIGAISAGAMSNLSGDSAKYQIRCRLIYYEGGDNVWQEKN